MSRATEDSLGGWVVFGIVVWFLGMGISEVFRIPHFWGIVVAIFVLVGALYLYVFYERRAVQKARKSWDRSPWLEATRENSQEAERQRKQAEETAARAKWKAYYESKSMADVAKMSGTQFEEFLARLFARMGYTEVALTETNDQGGDLLCLSPTGVRIVVQAKRWKTSVGNGAVQELLGAMLFYGRDEGLVVTSSKFTPSAHALAGMHPRITLRDGRWLAEQIKLFLPAEVPEFSWEVYNRVVKGYKPPRAGARSKFKFRRSKRGRRNNTWTVRGRKQEAAPQDTAEKARTSAVEGQFAAEQQKRVEEQQREERKKQFVQRRQQEERQKVEAAVAKRKRQEVEDRERDRAQEEQRKQEEERTRRAAETSRREEEQRQREELAQRVKDDTSDRKETSKSERHEKEKARISAKLSGTLARVAVEVVTTCRGNIALRVKEVRQLITNVFSARLGRPPTHPELMAIESAVVDQLDAYCSPGWIFPTESRSKSYASSGCGSRHYIPEDTSPWQDNAIRAMEGD